MASGDIQQIDGRWYVTHAGLLRTAQRRRCSRHSDFASKEPVSDPIASRWVFKATVYKTPTSKGFVGYGDADPSNTSLLWSVAPKCASPKLEPSTGLCEKPTESDSAVSKSWGRSQLRKSPPRSRRIQMVVHESNGSSNGQPRLRDQLCLLIRQHNLDPTLVKAYAADFCGTQTLKDASRDLVESFISHLSSSAKEDRDGLICKLNSYSHPAEVKQ